MDDYYENEKRFNEKKEMREKALDNFAKSHLKKTVKTSIETAAIGALSDFEEFFGYLWAHGKHYNELNEEQRDFREKWLDARDSVLRRAANSTKIGCRAVDRAEFSNYDNKKYKTIIKSENKNGRYKENS